MKIEEFDNELDDIVISYEKFKPVELPNVINVRDVPKLPYNEAHEKIMLYAKDRKLLDTEYDLFICDDFMLKNRLIIPLLQSKK